MSEPMPGAVPAQQDGPAGAGQAVPAEPGGHAEPAGDAAAQAPAEEPPGVAAPPREHADVQGTADTADTSAAPGGATETGPAQAPESGPDDEDDGPRPLGLHVEPTGYAPVDAELRRLEDADHLAVSGHLEVYEDVHRGLRETLSGLDRPAPGPAGQPGPSARPGPRPAPGPGHPQVSGRPVPGPQHPRS